MSLFSRIYHECFAGVVAGAFMTLLVHRCVFKDDGRWGFADEIDPRYVLEPGEEMAGFESWRTELWGSPLSIRLGCVILPQLRDDNVHCSSNDLALLLRDTDIILANLSLLAKDANAREDSIAHRTHNIRNATLWAIEHSGMVLIW